MANQVIQQPSFTPSGPHLRNFGSVALSLPGKYYLQCVLVVGAIVLAGIVPNFGSISNLQSILLEASFAGFVACGETLLIAAGLFDLSVAGLMAISAIAMAQSLTSLNPVLAILIGLAVGALGGLLNGLIVTKVKIPAFIATLGMMNIYLAGAFIWTDGNVVIVTSPTVLNFAGASVLGFPIPFLVFAAVCVVGYFLLQRTYFGRTLRAIGSSEQATTMAGLPVNRVKIIAFVVAGLMAGIGAIALTGLLSSASGTMASGYELNAIAIAVVGGTGLRGGQGTFFGTFTAALFFAALDDALNLLNINSYWQYVAIGGVLVIALFLGALRQTTVRGAE
jgi:ribose transport system permease protein